MNLNEYIKIKYHNKTNWFVDEVQNVTNVQRINKVISHKDYLNGRHAILQRPPITLPNGQVVEPRKIVINLAKQLISYQTAFLLKNKMMVVGVEHVADQLNEVNARAKYDLVNSEILRMLLTYGQCAEYVYLENGEIKSKLMSADEYTPVYNRHNKLIGLIEHYLWEGVTYYTVYDDGKVQEWNNEGGTMRMTAQYASLTGLPVVYVAGDYGDITGRSDLEDWKGILDNLEDVLSKFVDSYYSFMNPIPIQVGQELKGQLNKEVIGGGFKLDDNGDFRLVSPKIDSQSFKIIYQTLIQTLLDVSSTPSVSMGRAEISNVSETSIKLMFSLADVKGYENEKHMRKGLYERYAKIRTLLEYLQFKVTDNDFYSIDFVFNYNVPMNDSEIIDNLRTLKEIGGYSMESILEKNPYVEDVHMEKERLSEDGQLNDNQGGTKEPLSNE